jgi:hypothetical protein
VVADKDPSPDFNRGDVTDDFERRFLDYAYATHERITSVSVAHALKLPIAMCNDRLESLAASDLIHRDVDDRGAVYYFLPGRADHGEALVPTAKGALAKRARGGDLLGRSSPAPSESVALTGLVINAVVLPGVGSIIAGRPVLGLMQLGLFIASVPLCFLFVGFPLLAVAWVWAVASGYAALRDAQKADLDVPH